MRPSSREDTTEILSAMRRGDPGASDRLLPLVYDELRDMARRQVARLPAGQTLQATALVHDAYMRLVGGQPRFEDRRHFFGAAARAMRNILVDEARRKGRIKRGGGRRRISLDEAALPGVERDEHLIALDEALHRFEAADPVKAEVVMLRFFAGMKIDEIAHAVGVSTATVDRYWAYARAWLHREIATQMDESV